MEKELAQIGYETYALAVRQRHGSVGQMVPWDTLPRDIQDAWRAAVQAMMQHIPRGAECSPAQTR